MTHREPSAHQENIIHCEALFTRRQIRNSCGHIIELQARTKARRERIEKTLAEIDRETRDRLPSDTEMAS